MEPLPPTDEFRHVVEARDYDPSPPPPEIMGRYGARMLDPATAEQLAGITPRSTIYVSNRLLLPGNSDISAALTVFEQIAEPLGLVPHLEDRPGDKLPYDAEVVTFFPRGDVPTRPPDAWSLLQWARSRFGIVGLKDVGLDHLMIANGRIMAVPFQPTLRPTADPAPASPAEPSQPPAAPPAVAPEEAKIADYVHQGGGGRQPVAWLGPAPHRLRETDVLGRRPVVAIMDTGCGSHPWLDPIVNRQLRLDDQDVGYAPPTTDPEVFGSLDDYVDAVAGHGTFMAGLVHLFCPDANLIAVRIVDHDGVVVESELVHSLAQIIELVRRDRDGQPGGQAIDVLVLSMGYYHETPEEDPFVPILAASLQALGRLGVVVVAAAGNDATARPMYPAALAPWLDGAGFNSMERDCVPVISVGATNPDGAVALFSNDGPWVRAWEKGASVVSTMPVTFHGGLQPVARQQTYGKFRSALDPDDYTAGFAVWSGTSFSAPALAGRLARQLQETMGESRESLGSADAVTRAWEAVAACTTLSP